MITVKLERNEVNVKKLYDDFYKNISASTGTILIHHGKAKYPGKYVKDYKIINLYLKDSEACLKLERKAKNLFNKYSLNKIFLIHRLGKIKKNDTILFIAIEAEDRISAFEAMRSLLEEIKSETLIGLKELK